MKISKQRIRKIILESLNKILNEEDTGETGGYEIIDSGEDTGYQSKPDSFPLIVDILGYNSPVGFSNSGLKRYDIRAREVPLTSHETKAALSNLMYIHKQNKYNVAPLTVTGIDLVYTPGVEIEKIPGIQNEIEKVREFYEDWELGEMHRYVFGQTAFWMYDKESSSGGAFETGFSKAPVKLGSKKGSVFVLPISWTISCDELAKKHHALLEAMYLFEQDYLESNPDADREEVFKELNKYLKKNANMTLEEFINLSHTIKMLNKNLEKGKVVTLDGTWVSERDPGEQDRLRKLGLID